MTSPAAAGDKGRRGAPLRKESVIMEILGAGARVRLAAGEHAGLEGQIVWLGRSRRFSGLCVKVVAQAGDDPIWATVSEVVAIDDEGRELDPQPRLPADPPEEEEDADSRRIALPVDLARSLTAIRLRRGHPAEAAAEAQVRAHQLRHAEETLRCTIPDAVIAYVVSGVGERAAAGVDGLIALTQDLQAAQGDERPVHRAERVAFDYDNGNFLAFHRGSERAATSYQLLDHEESYRSGPSGDLGERLARLIDEDITDSTPGFAVILDDTPPAPEPDAAWVTHAKFGRGSVTRTEPTSRGDKLTIDFEDGETRTLLARFVRFE
ncbi:MAG: hypothetical protein R3A79_29720 [Nannocystaceae bacterium]